MQKIEEFNEIWVRAAVDLNEQRLGGTKVQKVLIILMPSSPYAVQYPLQPCLHTLTHLSTNENVCYFIDRVKILHT